MHVHNDALSKYLSKLESLSGQLILLDERGETFTSVDFSKKVQSWTLHASDTHIAIGPAEGWSNLGQHLPRISLSEMTFPHEIAAVLFLEQLYRAFQIIKGTSLAYIIGFHDLMLVGKRWANAPVDGSEPFIIFPIMAVLYFGLCYPLALFARQLEQKALARGQ